MNPIVIHAGNFWDGLSGQPTGPKDIRIDGKTITAVENDVDVCPEITYIDLSDCTVMPGLIDCHVHLTLRPEIIGNFWRYSPSYKALLGVEALRTLLLNGFTTVRDCGDMDLHGFTVRDLKDATEQGIIPGPRLICSGHMISSRGGHMNALRSLSPDSTTWENCLADGQDEIQRVVRSEIKRGAEWIKFAASGGFSSTGDDPAQVTYTRDEMDVIVETARDFNRPVSAHVIGDEAVRESVLAGVRSVEHGSMARQETIGLIEHGDTYIVPTQMAAVKSARLSGDDAYWRTLHIPSLVRKKIQKYHDAIMDGAQYLANSSVKIAFGTDLGILSYRINGAREFGEMVTNGITHVRALQAATSMAAELLQHDDIGTLTPGRRADIIAVPGNPFKDIIVMERVNFVMQSGIIRKQNGMPFCVPHMPDHEPGSDSDVSDKAGIL